MFTHLKVYKRWKVHDKTMAKIELESVEDQLDVQLILLFTFKKFR